jgi:hypothetical protein
MSASKLTSPPTGGGFYPTPKQHPPNTPHETEFIKHIKRFGHG